RAVERPLSRGQRPLVRTISTPCAQLFGGHEQRARNERRHENHREDRGRQSESAARGARRTRHRFRTRTPTACESVSGRVPDSVPRPTPRAATRTRAIRAAPPGSSNSTPFSSKYRSATPLGPRAEYAANGPLTG